MVKRSKLAKRLLAVGATVAVIAAGVLAYGSYTSSIEAASCPSNDIMPCGASNRSEFISKLKKNNPSDMDNIYANSRYDLPASEYNRFANEARKGKIDPKSGNITVDGVTVGLDAQSIGRNSKGSISHAIKIDGKTYYETPIRLLTENTNDAMVLFDEKGNVQTVIMNICGNPMTVTPKSPKYKCDMLNSTKVDNDTYKFSSKIDTSNGAKVTKVVYDFGDGSSKTETSPSTVVTHDYAKPGTYTAKVTAYIKTPFSKHEFPITVTADCQKKISVEGQKTPHIKIEKLVNGKKHDQVNVNQNYNYTVKVTNDGQVDLTNAVVTDTPKAGSNIQLVSSNGVGTINGNVWTYTIPSLKVGESRTFTLTAKVTAPVEGKLVNDVCVDAPQVPGNPDDCDDATVEVPKPLYSCDKLTVTKIGRTDFKFQTDYTVKNATYVKTVYIIRDSNGAEIARSENASYTQTTPGDYSVEAQVIVRVDGVEKVATSPACKKPIKVNPESVVSYTCDDLAVKPLTRTQFEFKTSYSVENATYVKTIYVVRNEAGTEIARVDDADGVLTYTQNTVGKYTVEATIVVTVGGVEKTATDPNCKKPFEVTEEEKEKMQVCIIGSGDTTLQTIDKDDFDATKHSTNPEDCEKPELPKELPSTGPAELLGSLVGTSALGYGAFTYATSRRAVRKALK